MLSSLSAKKLLSRGPAPPRAPEGLGALLACLLATIVAAPATASTAVPRATPSAATAAATAGGSPAQGDDRDIAALLNRLETIWSHGDADAYAALLAPSADRTAAAQAAAQDIRRDLTRVVIRERDRVAMPDVPEGTGYSLILEALLESGARGSIGTWRLDIVRGAAAAGEAADAAGGTPPPAAGTTPPAAAAAQTGTPGTAAGGWAIKSMNRLTGVQGLYRLSLAPAKQFRIRNLKVTAEDLTLTIGSGVAFAADADGGTTAWVLMGRGVMSFLPKPAAERGQIKLFAGSEELRSDFDTLFLRLNPADADSHVSSGALEPEAVQPQALARAQAIFNEEIVKSFGLDLNDLSRDVWSLVPPVGDFLAEVRTDRFGPLTYARASNDAEDISLFDRRHRKNLSAYASETRLATRGRFYNDSDQADYEVAHYDINTTFDPEREWVDGRTVLRLRVRSHIMSAMTLRLADSLIVRTVSSPRFGRLLALRVKGQNSVLVNFPEPLSRGDEVTLAVSYAGRLPTAAPDREVMALTGQPTPPDPQEQSVRLELSIPPEPRVLYTNRSYWYPQSTVTDYSTATLRLTVPDGQSCVATGALASGSPVRLTHAGEPPQLLSVFTATQPARYFAVIITRLATKVTDIVRRPPSPARVPPVAPEPEATTMMVTSAGAMDKGTGSAGGSSGTAAGGGGSSGGSGAGAAVEAGASPRQPPSPTKLTLDELQLSVMANPRQGGRLRTYADQTSSILSTYAGILEDIPYPTFTLTLVDDALPGGHSPAYFALLNQPLPSLNFTWRNDPVSFDRYPQFFLAHELAHQFWGDAVGGQNYHEQWISEGFAQYFAVLYAERSRSKDTFEDVLRQLRRTSMTYDRYGPVWLGYRLGHLQNDSRIFRALVYNKGALVLHMLRRLLGDDAFFRGLRRFYRESRFQKVGTEDVRKAFEAESGQPLERFFERWILSAGVPRVAFSYNIVKSSDAGGAPALHVRFEQKGDVFDFPVTVRVRYADGRTEDLIVPVTDRDVERTLPLKETPRDVRANDDDGALIELVRS